MISKLAQGAPPPGAAPGWPKELPDEAATIEDFETIFGNVIYVALGAAGIALFIMVIIGGFKWATAGENPEQAAAARKTLTAAIIGLVFVVVSFLIMAIIENFTGANVTIFNITIP